MRMLLANAIGCMICEDMLPGSCVGMEEEDGCGMGMTKFGLSSNIREPITLYEANAIQG